MTKLAFDTQHCQGATSGATGNHYAADKSGFIHVENNADIKCLTSGGYTLVGSVARTSKYWVCDDCGRDCNINSCGRCGAMDLRKVVE